MSNFYDQASLVLVPSGYKDQKLYAQKPQTTAGQFQFNRGSDLEVTRVNSQGKIEKAILNGLFQSNTFSTTWANNNSSETGGQADKDGGTSAWLLTATSAGGFIYQDVVAPGIQTFSVYAKAGSQVGVTLYSAHVSQGRYFNLSTGALGGTFVGTPIASSINAVGGGWYRCSITVNASTLNNFRIYVSNGTANVAGTAYIQNAQLNYGLVAQDYVETTTAAVISGLKLDTPRLNYDPANPTCPSLLLEPSRQNLMPSSEDIDNLWSKLRVTVENNSTTSPEGVVNAGKSTATAVAGTHASYDTISGALTGGNAYFISCFVKKVNTKYIRLNEGYTGAYVDFNFDDQTTDLQNGASDLLLEQYPNGWYRLGFKFTADASGNGQFALYINDDNNTTSYTGAGEAVYLWGAQIEAGSYPTSYIPTYGSSATRLQGSAQKTSASSIIGQTEGTIFAQVGDFPKEFNGRIIAITQNSSNYITILKNGDYNDFYTLCAVGGATQMSYQGTGSLSDNAKIAVAYANNDFVIYVNGTQVHTDTSGNVPTCSNLFIGKRENGTVTYSTGGSVSQALLFKTRLSNADLATLTSL